MNSNRSIPNASIIPELGYDDVRAAAAWLCDAFGFTERLRIGDHRVQLTFGSGALVVVERGPASSAAGDARPACDAVMVRVDNVDAHHARAARHGARIVRPPTDHPYGERQYTAADPDGHAWTFTQTIADVDPADWGGELVDSGS
ncbi:MAG TPA: VOC family protein [Longimicrobiaceae bacterium]|nr:VOC family protein [Longimicrobiaceae bacterium]